jgi:hypothetical protein
MSELDVQPISGSGFFAISGENSSTHFFVLPRPDCIALRAGR